jgi:hypothetical protein
MFERFSNFQQKVFVDISKMNESKDSEEKIEQSDR